ncbi:hypothetical protein RINTHH_20650 [Richelia intracellularis HH01]|uniref:Uncharacterized protein n=1 Tax=Richelia intracellularis HH01 TaxID=1165094 RepID=M1X3A2_9NOST|nr:hypothetical protein RINTHH_20650 [Richelia intracellularis HH01]
MTINISRQVNQSPLSLDQGCVLLHNGGKKYSPIAVELARIN